MKESIEGESEQLPEGAASKVEVTERLRVLSHDLRNALHGTALNLEVVRSRLSRTELTEKDIDELLIPFLENAAMQLDAAAKLHQQYTEVAMTFVKTK